MEKNKICVWDYSRLIKSHILKVKLCRSHCHRFKWSAALAIRKTGLYIQGFTVYTDHPMHDVERPSWDQYFLKMAMLVSERATCPRMHCGCVLVRDKRILSTGYNGSLPGDVHCKEAGCLIVDNHCVRTIHAEMNAIIQCALHGVSTLGAIAYVTNMPCTKCAQAIISAGIKEVIIFSHYHGTLAEDFFARAAVPVKRLAMPETGIHYDLASFPSAEMIPPETEPPDISP